MAVAPEGPEGAYEVGYTPPAPTRAPFRRVTPPGAPAVSQQAIQAVTGQRQASTAAAEPTRDQRDARERIRSILDGYGLGGLADLAWQLIITGASDAEIMRKVRETPEWMTRFGNTQAAQLAAGRNPMSAEEIMATENSYASIMHEAGLPPGMYDSPDDYTALLIGAVSPSELGARVVDIYGRLQREDPETRRQLAFLGVSEGQQLAWIMDPNVALPLIETALTQAEIGASSIRSGFGQLSAAESAQLAGWSATGDTAGEGFAGLTANAELFSGLPGENAADISRQDQLEAAFGGSVEDQQTISRRRRARQAAFEGGGALAQTAQGVVGLGSAAS